MTTSSGSAATRKKASTHKEPDASSSSQTERQRVNLDLELPLLAEINDWRFAHKFDSRQEAMRELLRRGMRAKEASKAS